jgi:hypothetical protein
MRAVVVYESMYGNTHAVAERIGAGLEAEFDVLVCPVEEASSEALAGVDLLVVGGPTHVHGMTSSATRKSAVEAASKDADLEVDPDAEGPGLRDWFEGLPKEFGTSAAAFDTRMEGPAMFTGRASKGIARRMRHHGLELVGGPESFLVDKHNHLLDGEADRAQEWATKLSTTVDRAESRP